MPPPPHVPNGSAGSVGGMNISPDFEHDDGMAVVVSFDAGRGDGLGRALVLGGGGVFFVAWLVAYLQGLEDHGVDVSSADVVVGTSAGAMVGAALTAGRLGWLARTTRCASSAPGVLGRLVGSGHPAPSARRATEMFVAAGDARSETVRAIGVAALAAHGTRPAARLVGMMMGRPRWADRDLRITATDCVTGERLVVTRGSGVPLVHAAAASATVPGMFTPQAVGDRRAMDGGVSGSGTHADLVAGAGRALVLAVSAGATEPSYTAAPDQFAREIDALRESGTRVDVRVARCPDGMMLMDPRAAGMGAQIGAQQAAEDVAALTLFWNAGRSPGA